MPFKWYPCVVELFREALEFRPDERAEFLAREGADPWVRDEVQSLLAHHERAEAAAFLTGATADPALALVATEDGDDLVGQTLGPYTITSRIGDGGFGSIYRAVRSDGQYQGRVALKVLKRGLDTQESRRRFRIERQTLARLEAHPHIVTLFDGGSTPDGRPYLVMEYVEGSPIDRYCDEHRLGIAARLRLFLQVCTAVQYAHQNSVIHCDLKPENILVTRTTLSAPDGVKLLDFGIARLLRPATSSQPFATTLARERPFTPAYASPEQFRGGRIGHTSDVYSLGVLLYELLTGHRPFSFAECGIYYELVVCEQEPEKPSSKVARSEAVTGPDGTMIPITPESVSALRADNPRQLRRKLAGDLDNIVLRALHKNPQGRYQSVGELSQDLQSYLQGNPVAARGNPFGYRTAKFARRHPGQVAATITALVVVGALIAWALSERSRAFREQDRAIKAEAEARKAVQKYLHSSSRDMANTDPAGQLPGRELPHADGPMANGRAWLRPTHPTSRPDGGPGDGGVTYRPK